MFGPPISNKNPKPGFAPHPCHFDFRAAVMKFQNVHVGLDVGQRRAAEAFAGACFCNLNDQ